jgi:hypothetical protein
MQPQLIRINDLAALKAAGLPFKSVHAARWCARTANEKGLADAFVKIGAALHVDPAKFHELARADASKNTI